MPALRRLLGLLILGVATAAACARVGMPCIVYMGAVDVQRQAPNV